jgi:hypothetical protein
MASSGPATLVIVEPSGRDRYDWPRHAAPLSAPRLLRAWRWRSWIEHSFRAWEHLLAIAACQMQEEEAHYDHVVLRLVAGLVLIYMARIVFKGRVMLAEILFSRKPHWRFLDSDLLDLQRPS